MKFGIVAPITHHLVGSNTFPIHLFGLNSVGYLGVMHGYNISKRVSFRDM